MTHTGNMHDETAPGAAEGAAGAQESSGASLRIGEAHSARMYDYLLGGKDNYPADQSAAEKAVSAFPTLRTAARENRKFLGRAVRYLVEEAGIRQFLDIGSGLPTAHNVHQVAQAHDPSARVVYVDNDPIVLAHGRALLSTDERTTVIQTDIRDPRGIIEHPETQALLDFTQPVAVLAVAVLHFLSDEEEPGGIVEQLRGALAPGSMLVLSHATAEISPSTALGVQTAYRAQGVPLTLRDRSALTDLFDGFELVDPGIQVVSDWRSTVPEAERPSHAEVSWYGGIGRLA
ncbi:SAM-dependent methyltransferase [Streptomyces tubbatahanensis]|uniref:SAM-dependent methyltransferase n=1 Tax=Streptomyces tubbatahanensis TaxID=2923272 RepID=A0ABY3XM23_9ACTN|nr:SAM-dependent methyltransferase [Streptomyces tubbatahanensis]UNS95440.1 SAM-dependent methyltransferase [Streptomyces tubbatahanensis]